MATTLVRRFHGYIGTDRYCAKAVKCLMVVVSPLFWLLCFFLFFVNAAQAKRYEAHQAEFELFDIVTNDDIMLFESNDVYLIDDLVFLPFNALSQALEFNLQYTAKQNQIIGQINQQAITINLNEQQHDYLFEESLFEENLLEEGSQTPKELWLSLNNINTLFSSTTEFNFSQLSIIISPITERFPLQKRIARSKKHITDLNLNTSAKPEFIIEDQYRLLTSPKGAVRLDINQNQDKQLDYGLNVQTYSDFLYHSANLNLARKRDSDLQARLTLTRHKSSPSKPLIGGLNRYQLGDVAVTNTRAGVGYNGVGVSFTSLENRYSNYYGKLTLDEFAPANWQAELYNNGYLIQTGTVNSEGKIQFTDIDTTYGINRFEIVLYGEYGEEQTIVREVMIGNNQLKPGDFNYTGAIIDTAHSVFNDTSIFSDESESQLAGYIQTEWGISHSTTLGLSLFKQQSVAQDSAAVSTKTGPADAEYIVSVTQQLRNALLDLNIKSQGQSGYAADVDLLGSLSNTGIRYQIGASVDHDYAGLQRNQSAPINQKRVRASLTGKWRKLGYQLSANQTATQVVEHVDLNTLSTISDDLPYSTQKQSRINNRLSYRFSKLSLTNTLTYQKNAEVSTLEDELALSGRVGQSMSVRASGVFDLKNQENDSFKSANLSLNWQSKIGLNNQTRLQYIASNSTTNVSNFFTWRQAQYNLTFSTTFDNNSHWNIALGISFNLDWDHHQNKLNISQAYTPATGTLDLFNFVDHNQNAFYDQYDEPLAGVKYAPQKQWQTIKSAANGASYLTGFSPYSPNGLYFDTFETSSNHLRPIYEDFKIYSHPGGIIALDLPFNYAVEIIGEINFDLPENHFQPQFIPLEIIQDEQVIFTALSEFDNTYLFERIWPGSYKIRIAADYLQDKNLHVVPNEINLNITEAEELIELEPFVIKVITSTKNQQRNTTTKYSTKIDNKKTENVESKEKANIDQKNVKPTQEPETPNKSLIKITHQEKRQNKPFAIQVAAYTDTTLCQKRLKAIRTKHKTAFLIQASDYCRIYTQRYIDLKIAKKQNPTAFIVRLSEQQLLSLHREQKQNKKRSFNQKRATE
ncbi:hypothetical protein [Algibacillus agarilyticus]|uniref:hypothetical protein n=1 Tax=Algibacillus agarilyticus TaxID=2234133 RepID=UPI000DCF65E8|nr:hypothetical protein [Algibacillus agarilyticus]